MLGRENGDDLEALHPAHPRVSADDLSAIGPRVSIRALVLTLRRHVPRAARRAERLLAFVPAPV